MKNRIILIIILFSFPTMIVKANTNFDQGDCISDFGSITLKSTGDKNYGGGRVKFSNKSNNKTWSTDTVSFDVEVQSKLSHKVKTVGYTVNSKDGYSCSDVVKGTNIENNTGSVILHVVINKGWVEDMAFWGKTVNRKDNSIGDTTKSNKISVKREMTDQELEEANQDLDITTGEKLTCVTIQDLLSKYWSWVMILAPIGSIFLITFDFVKPIISSNEDALKKASSNAIKRTIALVILLMLPVITNIIFGLFGIETCF